MSEGKTTNDAPRDAAPAASSGLMVLPPLIAMVEIALLVVLPGLLDYFVPGFPSLNDTQPHFFWLPVVLLSVQYGSVSGLVAAGAAIVLNNLLGWPEQEIGENHFSYLLRVWLQPVLWLATAIILGQFRLRQIERKEALTGTVQELSGQRLAISDHARNLRARCEHLERILANRHDPDARRLLAALGGIVSHEPASSRLAFHQAMALGFGPSRTSVYIRNETGLQLVDRFGEGSDVSPVAAIAPASPFYQAAVERGRSLSVLDPGDEDALRGHGIAAVPISAAGQPLDVLGVVVLEAAAPDELDHSTVARLHAIAGLLALSLQAETAGRSRASQQAAAEAERPGTKGRGERLLRHARWGAPRSRPQPIRAGSRSG